MNIDMYRFAGVIRLDNIQFTAKHIYTHMSLHTFVILYNLPTIRSTKVPISTSLLSFSGGEIIHGFKQLSYMI